MLDAVVAALRRHRRRGGAVRAAQGRARRCVILDNCEHVVDAAAALAVRLLDAAPALRVLCTSQVPLDVDGEARPRARAARARRRRRALHPARRRAAPASSRRGRRRGARPVPLARRAAARDRARRGAHAGRCRSRRSRAGSTTASACCSDPTSRKPERRRALRATIRWSYELLFPDDQRGLWALATFAGGAPLAAVESVLEALDVPAPAAIDVVGRLASRSLVIVDEDDAPRRVRYRLLDSIRAFALEAMAEAGLTDAALAAHAAWFADAAQRPPTACAAAARPTPRVRAGRAGQHRRRPRLERRARPRARAGHRERVRLGVDRPRRQPRRAAHPDRARRRRATRLRRATARRRCCSQRGSRRRPATSSRRASTSARPTATRRRDRRRRPAGALRLLPRLRRVARRRVRAGAWSSPTAAARSTTGSTGPGTRPRTRSSPPGRRSRPATSERAVEALRPGRALAASPSTTRGCTSAATRCSASSPASSTASTTPSRHLARGGETSGRLGFLQTEAYQLAEPRPRPVPGRRLRGRRGHAASSADRQGRGHRRRPPGRARARPPRARAAGARRGRPRPARRSRRPPRGTARPAAASRRRSASACSPRWTPPTASRARKSDSTSRSRRREPTTTPTSRSSRSTRSRGSRGRRATMSPVPMPYFAEADRRIQAAAHFISERDPCGSIKPG